MKRLVFFILLINFTPLAKLSFAGAPEIPEGIWMVEKTSININSERTLNYQYNDPRLNGRYISFNKNVVRTNLPEKFECNSPGYSSSTSDLNELILTSIGNANASDYEVESGSDKITAIKIVCKSGSFGGADTGVNSWVALINDHTIIINWYDDTLLTLKKTGNLSAPNPSFDCKKATAKSEIKICSDAILSSYDQSVNKAWWLVKNSPDLKNDLRSKENMLNMQKAWLVKRNRCDDDTECLTRNMIQRLNELMARSNQ
ncbi:hypothetical protein [Erwinia sp. 9145]|uniref:lysozyme inhibitor LprI family protein n=1 Tax=Erwinia sp. 9145 TaxID=1500895 RepID=UPI000907BB8F|nr:hypothetical protein [Erwinia sp. 9145]